MPAPGPLIVLGCGPVGLLAAIRGRQLGLDVEIQAGERPLSHHAPRVESVPSQTIALLVEFGVHPRRLGGSQLAVQRTEHAMVRRRRQHQPDARGCCAYRASRARHRAAGIGVARRRQASWARRRPAGSIRAAAAGRTVAVARRHRQVGDHSGPAHRAETPESSPACFILRCGAACAAQA